MLLQILTILDWTLWSAMFVTLGYALISLLAQRNRGQASSSLLGVLMLGIGLVCSGATGVLLLALTQRQSLTGLTVMTLLLAWPLVALGGPSINAFKSWKQAHAKPTRGNVSAP